MNATNGNGNVNIVMNGRNIPKNLAGDPCFKALEDIQEVFTEQEIVALVNRALYHKEYMRVHHQKRAEAERALIAPVKAKAKTLFPGTSWLRLTDEQVAQALEALKAEKEGA